MIKISLDHLSWWVSATDFNRYVGEYAWEDGRPVDKSLISNSSSGQCVSLDVSSGKLVGGPCQKTTHGLCEVGKDFAALCLNNN